MWPLTQLNAYSWFLCIKLHFMWPQVEFLNRRQNPPRKRCSRMWKCLLSGQKRLFKYRKILKQLQKISCENLCKHKRTKPEHGSSGTMRRRRRNSNLWSFCRCHIYSRSRFQISFILFRQTALECAQMKHHWWQAGMSPLGTKTWRSLGDKKGWDFF